MEPTKRRRILIEVEQNVNVSKITKIKVKEDSDNPSQEVLIVPGSAVLLEQVSFPEFIIHVNELYLLGQICGLIVVFWWLLVYSHFNNFSV